MKTTIFHAVALCALSLPVRAASAQELAEGGFPIGEKSKIHTNLDLAMAFDSNPARQPSTATELSDWRAVIRPGIVIRAPGETLSLDLHSQLSVNQYFGTGGRASDTLFGADLGLGFGAGSDTSAVALRVEDNLIRTPAVIDAMGTIGADEVLYPVWYNRGRAYVALRPGGGALEIDLGYRNELSLFDDLADTQQHGALLNAKLRFLPKTALYLNSDLAFFSASTDGVGGATTRKSSPLNVTVGLIGQLTSHLSTNVGVGFGDTLTWKGDFFSEADHTNQATVIGVAGLEYAFGDRSSVSVGYTRRTAPTLVVSTYVSDAARAALMLGLTSRLLVAGGAQVDSRKFPGLTATASNETTLIISGDARVEYWFFSFLNASVAYRAISQSADATTAAATPGAIFSDFVRHEFFVNAGLRY